MAAKIVKKEVMSDEIKEFGEDAEIAINELLGLYGYNEEQKRNELRMKLGTRNSCKKIANISQKLMESKRQLKGSESESLRVDKMNDYSSISSDKDSSSREDSKSPMVLKSIDKTQENNCSWCHQNISAKSNEVIGTGGNCFCSENCFLLWRRASFKRAKTCDFCKNVRNAVSYVDFNDGTTQLQFCSDKCLNQYKMKIFCRETQAQLELNPHLKENNNDSGESLITPELWLKNCRTRSPTPEKERFLVKSPSKSPSPITFMSAELNENMIKSLRMSEQPQTSISSLVSQAKITGVTNLVQSSKKPLINVLPSSKLLSRNLLHHKSLRKRRVSTRLTQSTKINQLRSNSNFTSHDLQGKIHTQVNSHNGKAAQSTSFNAHPNMPNQSVPSQFTQRPPINLFKLRMPFTPNFQHRMPILQHQSPPEDDSNLNLLPPPNPLLPPSVVLVPYAIPLPIIIPIPLPLTAFLKAYQTKGYSGISSNGNDNDSHENAHATTAKGARANENEQPLDLSSEQQGVFCETDKNFISHGTVNANSNNNNNNNGEVTSDSEIQSSKAATHENITDYEAKNKMQHHAVDRDDVSYENNRPLRKRKIIAELSQSQ